MDRADLARRLATRNGHFFPAQLLDSQLSEVELPGTDEQAIVVPETSGPAETVSSIVAWLDRKPARS